MAGEHVLIVDDEPNIRLLLERLCRREGYEAVTAENGAAAMRCLELHEPDLCIIDLRLPDTDGIQILRRVKERYPDCEVIILTAYADLSTAVQALRLGAYDYLQKPVQDIGTIINTLARALERQRLARDNVRLLQGLQEANRELEQRRRQQLQMIAYIGQAMSGALNGREVSRVLVRAILDAVDCDAAAVLVLRQSAEPGPWALIGGRRALTPEAARQLVEAMNTRLPPHLRCAADGVCLELFPGGAQEEADSGNWPAMEVLVLEVRGDAEGVVAMARHAHEPWTEETLRLFHVLATQGGTALANARLFARTRELATRDGVTGIYNHRHFFELLENEISRSERHNLPLAVIMLDIDRGAFDDVASRGVGLKAINDTFGHQAGDALLRDVAGYLESTVRRADSIARYGGDEFVILAPQTSRDDALTLARRVRQSLGRAEFHVAGTAIRLTASVGVSVFQPGTGDTAVTLVRRADQGLYLAKEQGGDRECLIESPQ
ncbi:MAG TPA: diguanylate cyclase [Chloroflexi bacterium]|jgi:two-component system cell cycle response regulator|nr:diguanylate cyclase [Chloroflexota bacterium]